jgi:gustatory receptor
VGLNFQEILLNVNLTTYDVPTQKEVEMFLVTIEKNPPIMNLNGYTNINRSLISANLSFMATYLVVLMQFKLSLLRTGKKAVAGLLERNVTVNEVQ